MVDSRVYPGLERKPGGPDNWVEEVGGLPSYIERIAKHLHYEKGMTISRSIAVAVNTVKRWAAGGLVAEHGTTQRVSAKTQAEAAAALAEWEAKKAAARAKPSSVGPAVRKAVNLTDAIEEIDLAQVKPGDRDKGGMADGSYPITNAAQLASAIRLCGRSKDHSYEEVKRHIMRRARALGLTDRLPPDWVKSLSDALEQVVDLTVDGRPSFKGNGGRYAHGFVPLNAAAVKAKAKGSPVRAARIRREYGKLKKKITTKPKTPIFRQNKGRTSERGPLSTISSDKFTTTAPSQRQKAPGKEASKGGGRNPNAHKTWSEIPHDEKIIRNGVRYVLTHFKGKQQLTQWVGENTDVEQTPLKKRVLYGQVSAATLADMTTADLRALLKNPRQPKSVKQKAYLMLKRKEARAKANG